METKVSMNVRGKTVSVPGANLGGLNIAVSGKVLKLAAIHGESWREDADAQMVAPLIPELKSAGIKADLFTFGQRLPDTEPKYNYYVDFDNVAAIRTDSFKDWWENRVPQETRKNVRRAGRRNVVVKTAEFNDALIGGLKKIYDETPIRQGRRFWHYGKDLETIRAENSSYLERSELIGAYHADELIGFLKMVYVGKCAHVMQIITMNAHYDKRPMNALVARAVEVCEARGIAYFIYGQYIYSGKTAGQLTEFKRRNGFEQFLLPRYYIPLTLTGTIALKLGLHRGLRRFMPAVLEGALLDLRAKYYQNTILKKNTKSEPEPTPPVMSTLGDEAT
jgi:hypothetical protein